MGLGWQHIGAGALAAAGLGVLVRRTASTAASLEVPTLAASTEPVRQFLQRVAPPLDGTAHKGQAGRVGVLGGSKDYTGAPYYAGQAALSVGADLLYLFTAEEACIPIKSYSPELMVTPVYSAKWPDGDDAGMEAMVSLVVAMLPRLHSLVIGPGLGRDDNVLAAVAQIILAARERGLPLVIDADGLFLVTQRPELVRGCKTVILTPNVIEFSRLRDALGVSPTPAEGQNDAASKEATLRSVCQNLDGVTILQKGAIDLISDGEHLLRCDVEGGPRRSGGLGDILAGTLGIVYAWASMATGDGSGNPPDHASVGRETLWAALAASSIARSSCGAAFAKHKRSTTAVHVLAELGGVFERYSPALRTASL